MLSNVLDPVRERLDRYGLGTRLDPDAYFDTSGEVLSSYLATRPGPPPVVLRPDLPD